MRKIAAALFALWSTLAAAQAPSPVPALPDTPRLTQYTISGTTCACAVNFALYGDGTDVDNWLQVFIGSTAYLSGDSTHGWTITSPSGSIGNIARPITDAVLTFNSTQTGTVVIVGARRPRRLTQFQENRGVAARDLNQAITDEIAQLREGWDKTDRAILGQPGEVFNLLPPASSRLGGVLAFDPGTGQPIVQPNVPSGSIPAGSITNSLLSNVPSYTVKCNANNSSSTPQDCTNVYLSYGGQSPISPPFQVSPFTIGLGIGGSYSANGTGNIFQLSSFATTTGTMPTVAMFGGGTATASGATVWGGNFSGIATASGANANGAEVDFEITASGARATGVLIASSNTFTNPGAFLQMQVNTSSPNTNGIVWNVNGGNQPVLTNLIATSGGISVANGINFLGSTFSNSIIEAPGFTVGPTGALVSGANGTAAGSLALQGSTSGQAVLASGGTGALNITPGNGALNLLGTTSGVGGFSVASTAGHIRISSSSTPTLTAGCNGTGSSVIAGSSDQLGQILGQNTAVTSCTITFGTAYANAPICVVSPGGAAAAAITSVVASTTTLIVGFASTANYVWNYQCWGN